MGESWSPIRCQNLVRGTLSITLQKQDGREIGLDLFEYGLDLFEFGFGAGMIVLAVEAELAKPQFQGLCYINGIEGCPGIET